MGSITLDSNSWKTIPGIHHTSREAMATVFEVYIIHEDIQYAQQAAWQAMEELDRLEHELSRFIENSDIYRINNLAPFESLRIGLKTLECLQLGNLLFVETNGAFDITIGFIVDRWFHKKTNSTQLTTTQPNVHLPSRFDLIELDTDQNKVRMLSDHVTLDLGGIGKGYALDQMAELLREWSIETALIHGGTSTVLCSGAPDGLRGWPVTLRNPVNRKQVLARIDLENQSISGSGLIKGQPIINPRTAKPVEGKIASWALSKTAATSDALSTAFMVMNPEEIEGYCKRHRDVRAIIISEENQKKGRIRKTSYGSWEDVKIHSL